MKYTKNICKKSITFCRFERYFKDGTLIGLIVKNLKY